MTYRTAHQVTATINTAQDTGPHTAAKAPATAVSRKESPQLNVVPCMTGMSGRT